MSGTEGVIKGRIVPLSSTFGHVNFRYYSHDNYRGIAELFLHIAKDVLEGTCFFHKGTYNFINWYTNGIKINVQLSYHV